MKKEMKLALGVYSVK